MKFQPERLIQLRNTLNINKAEAARRLNISPMVLWPLSKMDNANPLILQSVSLRRHLIAT